MRKVFAVLDIETITNARLAFDIAWIVCDSKGNELEHANYLVEEITTLPFFMPLLTSDNFMHNKSDFYLNNFNNFTIAPLGAIADDFNDIKNRYNAQVVMCAYNAKFDYEVLNKNNQMYNNCNFFNDDIKTTDIMTVALSTICDSDKFVVWCALNGHLTEKNNVKSSAETVYAYIKRNASFKEAHHALEDCEIEKEILFTARKTKKKQSTQFAMPVFACPEWKAVQSRKKHF